MKTIWYMVWLLCAVIVAASLDNVPDPPAINPHPVNLKASQPGDSSGEFREQRVTDHVPCFLLNSPARPAEVTAMAQSSHPSDVIVLAGYAADPSPPLL